MKKLSLYFAIGLWAYVFGQACELQYQDDQAFATISHNACSLADDQPTLEQDLKLDAERLQAIDPVAAQIVLDTVKAVQDVQQNTVLAVLDSLQAQKEVDLGNIYFTASDTLGHLNR